jgi:hypothetical protein
MRPYARLCSIEVLGGPQRVSAVALSVTTTTSHGADIRCMTELANRRESGRLSSMQRGHIRLPHPPEPGDRVMGPVKRCAAVTRADFPLQGPC